MYDGGSDDLSTTEQIWIVIGICSIIPIRY